MFLELSQAARGHCPRPTAWSLLVSNTLSGTRQITSLLWAVMFYPRKGCGRIKGWTVAVGCLAYIPLWEVTLTKDLCGMSAMPWSKGEHKKLSPISISYPCGHSHWFKVGHELTKLAQSKHWGFCWWCWPVSFFPNDLKGWADYLWTFHLPNARNPWLC